jgi:hypothetical protein
MKGLSEKGKLLIGYSVAGITFSVLITLSIALLSGTVGLNFDNNVQGIMSAFVSGDPMAILITAITVGLFGVFIWLFGYIGAVFKSKVSGGTVKLQKRPHIVGFFLMGIIGIGIFGVVDQILAGVGTSSDPVGLLAFTNPLGIVVQFIFYSVVGFTVIWLGSKFTAIEKPLPDSLKRV